ncbi:MAG: hypothetical protein B1H11_04920 [Desulfobacteraceae bacterium 4484_190.1]|nr:MAG: hypothetical protein B1H11_04920 [Desulfobacteraceae bacterium 4484_190.1]
MLESVDPGLRGVLLAILEEIEKQQKERVTKDEFIELKQIVAELVEAQKRTEARVEELAEAQKRTEARVEELAEAQKRTEARVEELAEAQKRTEVRVEELAEAQKRTEVRVEELAEAQKRTEARVEELAEAQKRTETEITKLSRSLRETRQMVGGLSDTVGYGLEDRAIATLPRLVKERYGIEPVNGFVRKFIEINGKETELNMFGSGYKDGRKWFVVGEGKAKLSIKDVDRFEKLLNRLKTGKVVGDHIVSLMVTYSTRPATENYARSKGIEIIWSYELTQF